MLHHTKNEETLCIDFPNGTLEELFCVVESKFRWVSMLQQPGVTRANMPSGWWDANPRVRVSVVVLHEHACACAFRPPKTKPHLLSQMGFRNLILTMTYSHMGKPHTTIGDAS
ncbi:hypothetical protein, partial [Pseudomonas sp. MPR-LB5]